MRRRDWTAADLDALEARVEEIEAVLDELTQQPAAPVAAGGDELDRQLKQLLVGLLAGRIASAQPAAPQPPGNNGGGQQ